VEFTKKVLAQNRVRLIGVCFGHQIIGRALEQKVGRSDRGWEVSVTPMELTAKGKELFGVKELVSRGLTPSRWWNNTTDCALSTLPGHPPNAPRRRLHPSTLYRTLGPLAALRRAGYVREEALDYCAGTPGVQWGHRVGVARKQAREGHFRRWHV
jgi:hypothetical protein